MTSDRLVCIIFLHHPLSLEELAHNKRLLKQADDKRVSMSYIPLTEATTYKKRDSIQCGHDPATSDVLLPSRMPSFTIKTSTTKPPQLEGIRAGGLAPSEKTLLTASRKLGHFRLDNETATPVVMDDCDQMTLFFPDDIHDKLCHNDRKRLGGTQSSYGTDGYWCAIGTPARFIHVCLDGGKLDVFPSQFD